MASIKPEKGLRLMNVKRIIRRVTDNDYLFTIFTKILAVLIGLVASFYSNRFLGPQLKGELGRISSLLSIVAVTANFGLYQPYPYSIDSNSDNKESGTEGFRSRRRYPYRPSFLTRL